MTYGAPVPHLDDTITPATLHQRCEQVAVPDFDWFNEPIMAIVDGFLHIDPSADAPAKHTGGRARRNRA